MKALIRRWWALGLGSVAFAAALWFTPGLWLRLDGWIQDQRDLVWEQLETLVGQKVVYDRIAPSVLAALDFQNVRLLADDGALVLTAASIRLSIDWGLLFEGRLSEALRKVQVINATLTLDQRRDQQLISHWASFIRPGGTTAFGYEVEGFNLKARWTDGVQTASLDRGFVVLTPEAGQWGLRFRGALAWQDERSGPAWVNLSVRGDLRSDAGFRNLSLRTEASALKTSWFDLEPVTLQIAVSPEQVTVAKVADRIPLDLQAVWDRTADRWTFKGAAEGFRPSRLVHLKNLKLWAGLADGTLSGRFSYRLGGDFEFDGRGDWPAGSWPAPFETDPVSVAGAVASEQGVLRFQGFRVEAPLLAVSFDGSLDPGLAFPEGNAWVERFSLPGVGDASGRLTLSRSGSRIVFAATDVIWNDLASEAASGWVEHSGALWNFSVEGPVDGTDGRFAAEGSVDTAAARFDAQIAVQEVALGKAEPEIRVHVPAFALPDEARTLIAYARGRVVWSPEGWQISETAFDLVDPERLERRLTGTVSWQGRALGLTLSTLRWDTVQGSGRFQASFEDGAVDWNLSGAVWDREVDLAGRWVPSDRTLVFSGQPGISGSLHQSDSGAWTADVALSSFELRPGWKVGFAGRLVYDAGDWSVSGERVDLTGRYPWNQEAFTVTGRLTADPGFLRLDGLSLQDARGRLVGSAVSAWSVDWTEPWAGRLTLATAATSRETLVLDWVSTASDRWHLGLRVGGLDLARVPGMPVQGRLGLTGSADWRSADNVAWNAQLALSEARWGDSPLGFRAALAGTNRKLSVRNVNVSVNSARLTDGSADFDADLRTWSANLGVGVRFGASDWTSRWTVTGGWTGPAEPFRTDFALKAQSNSWAKKTFPDATVSGRWGSEGWQAAFGDRGLVATGFPDGSFRVRAQAPFPVAGDAFGTWTSGSLALAIRGFRADLGLVKEFVNSPLFSVSQGEALGDLTLSGSPSDPEVNGTLTLRGLAMASSFVRQPLGPVDVPVTFVGHRVQIDPVNVGPSGQTWLVSGGARLDHLLPEEFQFSVQTDALSVIPVSYQYTGLSAVGGVTGLLVVKGTPLAVTLGGRLVLQDTTITLKQSQPAAASGLGFNADLSLVTGRKVEFLWPNETLPLLRAVTVANQTIAVKANDVASTWSVNGKLALKTGEINYLSRTFVVKEGQLVFQENQSGFDPRISVRAEWKVRETAGDILINLRADGNLSRFSPRFDAVPYQSPEQLQQLVGSTLALPSDYSKATSMDTALSLASDVGTSFLLTPFEETVKRNFQLDLFTVKTEVLKKSLLARNGPLEASDYLDNTRLFFGKYIGDDLFLQGTLAFRRDGSVATQVSPRMVVEPEFQMEFQTPFFLLNWTLLPLHPETLFVTDNTVTFRWNWSY